LTGELRNKYPQSGLVPCDVGVSPHVSPEGQMEINVKIPSLHMKKEWR
jgi:hypothetical protein